MTATVNQLTFLAASRIPVGVASRGTFLVIWGRAVGLCVREQVNHASSPEYWATGNRVVASATGVIPTVGYERIIQDCLRRRRQCA